MLYGSCVCQFIEVLWRHMPSHNLNNIDSDSGLMPVQCQDILLTIADLLSIRTLGINCGEIWIKLL